MFSLYSPLWYYQWPISTTMTLIELSPPQKDGKNQLRKNNPHIVNERAELNWLNHAKNNAAEKWKKISKVIGWTEMANGFHKCSWFSIPEWKTMGDQLKLLFQETLHLKNLLVGWASRFLFGTENPTLYVLALMGVSIYVEIGDQIRGGAVIGCPSAWHSRHLERLSHTLNPAGKIICHCTLG